MGEKILQNPREKILQNPSSLSSEISDDRHVAVSNQEQDIAMRNSVNNFWDGFVDVNIPLDSSISPCKLISDDVFKKNQEHTIARAYLLLVPVGYRGLRETNNGTMEQWLWNKELLHSIDTRVPVPASSFLRVGLRG
eukprot:scaffold21988_cov53-Attheya_sp.AAC.9